MNRRRSISFEEEKEESPKDLKSSKQHTNFKRIHHQGTPYLKRIIAKDQKNPSRFICLACQDKFKRPQGGFCENLKVHLMNKKHEKTLTSETLKRENSEAVRHLERIQQETNTSQTMEEHEEIRPRVLFIDTDKYSIGSNEISLQFEIVRFLITQNLPFSLGAPLLQFIQRITNEFDETTLNNVRIYDKKISFIAKDCMARGIQEKYFAELENSPFSVSLDIGSDKSGKSFLGLSVHYFQSIDKNQPQTRFIGLIELEDSHTGQVIYDKVSSFLFSRKNGEILKKNFIGLCTDHGSNMISTNKSNAILETGKGLANRFIQDFKHIFIVHDYAHAFNLIIEEAVSKFPAEVLNTVNGICSYFSRSPQQKAKFYRFQRKTMNKPPLEIIRYVVTRWSSLKESLDRILELESPLTSFFKKYGTSTQRNYFKKENMLYLKMLSCLLGKLHFYTKFFQGEDLSSYEVLKTLKESLVLVGELIVEIPAYLDTEISYEAQEKKFNMIYEVPFDKKDEYSKFIMDPKKFKENLLRQYSHLQVELEGIDEEFESQLFQVAQDFVISALERMKHWLPFDNQKLFNTEVIYLKHYDINKWIYLKDKFPNIIPQEDQASFQEQIQRLKYNLMDIKADAAHYPILEVWRKNKSKFPLLFELARAFLVIPYSSCSIERVFSMSNDIKTLKRNRLSVSNLESCLLIKQEFGISNFEFSEDMFSRFNKGFQLEELTPTKTEPQIIEKFQEKFENEMEIEEDNKSTKNTLDVASQFSQSIFHAATKFFHNLSHTNQITGKRLPIDTLVRPDIKKTKSNETKTVPQDSQITLYKEEIQIHKEDSITFNKENTQEEENDDEIMIEKFE